MALQPANPKNVTMTSLASSNATGPASSIVSVPTMMPAPTTSSNSPPIPAFVTLPIGPDLQLAIGQAVLQQSSQMAAHVHRLDEQLRSASMQRGLLRTELSELEARNKELMQESIELHRIKATIIPDLEKKNAGLEEALQGSSRESKTEMARLRSGEAEMCAKLDLVTESRDVQEVALRNENNGLLLRLQRLEADHKAREAELKTQESKRKREAENLEASIKEELLEARLKIKGLQQRQKESDAVRAELEGTLKDAETSHREAIVVLQAEVEQLKEVSATDTATIDALKSRELSLESSLKETAAIATSDVAMRDVQITALTQHLLGVQKEAKELREQGIGSSLDTGAIEIALKENDAQWEARLATLVEEHGQVSFVLQSRIDAVTEENSRLEASLQSNIAHAELMLKESNESNASLKVQIAVAEATSRKEISNLTQRVHKLDILNEELEVRLSDELVEYTGSLERYKTQIADLQKINRRLEVEARKHDQQSGSMDLVADEGDIKSKLQGLGLLKSSGNRIDLRTTGLLTSPARLRS